MLAISVGIFPDAWVKLAECNAPDLLLRAFENDGDVRASWSHFCLALSAVWRAARKEATSPIWTGGPWLSDWSRTLVTRAALAGLGRSLRALERCVKRWTGQTRGLLAFHAAFDELHRLSTKASGRPLADVAIEAGYSDQSHMGRAVRRATGFSPARLNRLIQTEEAFWSYRLLGERF